MNIVKFPILNLTLYIKKVAFTIFGISIYWYGIIIVGAILLDIVLLKKQDGLYNIEFDKVITIIIYLIPISLISARIYYILFNLDYYSLNPMEILNIRNGGIAIYGGVIGALITAVIFCKKKKRF